MRAAAWGCVGVMGLAALARAAEFHAATAQELQNALTAAAANGEGDTVYVAAGYYTGNFNFNSAEAQSLTVQAESGVANTEVTVDGAGTGRSMNLVATAAANLTVRGLTFTRNCVDIDNAGLRLSTSGGDVTVETCRAIGVTSDLGMGIEIAAAKNATVRDCTVTRDATSQGDGISVSGVTGGVAIDRNVVIGSRTSAGAGVCVYVGSTVPVTVNENNVCSNDTRNGFSTACYGIYCSGGIAALTGNVVNANNGRGIYCSGSATLTGNTVSGNSGGGIFCGGTATLTENTVSGNTTFSGGGGIYVSGTATLTGNTVSGNTATSGSSGGGIYCGGTATLTANTVSGNGQTSTSSTYGGGGIYCNSTATLTGNTVTGNEAFGGYGGGGICCQALAYLDRNTLTGNRAKVGGGIAAYGATVRIRSNIVAKNTQTTAGYVGGGLYVNATALLELVNNTVTENAAAGSGGGCAFQVDGVTEILHVYNNIIWGNTATGNGDDVHLAGSGSRKEFLYNDAHDLYGVWDIASDNIDAAPLFYDAANLNYHLRSGSPCLNAGYNAAPSIPGTDVDGEARIADTTVDIGADEMSNTDPHPADLNNDWVISAAEYTAYAAAWKNDQAWSRQPNPVPADYVTRAGYLKQLAGGAYRNDGGPKPTCWVPAL